MTTKIKPNRIIALTETTRVRHFTLGLRRASRVAVWRGFRLVASFGALVALVLVPALAHAETDEQRTERYRRQSAEACQNLAMHGVQAHFDRATGVCRVP